MGPTSRRARSSRFQSIGSPPLVVREHRARSKDLVEAPAPATLARVLRSAKNLSDIRYMRLAPDSHELTFAPNASTAYPPSWRTTSGTPSSATSAP